MPGEGAHDAEIMLIGEAPGATEDELGRPFVGRSGELLTTMLREINIERNEVFITSVLKCRPPDNRPPIRAEIEACRPYLIRQIEMINPRILVLLGSTAVSTIVGPWPLSESHGRFIEDAGRLYFITYHPAAALRFPQTAQKMRDDLQTLAREIRKWSA